MRLDQRSATPLVPTVLGSRAHHHLSKPAIDRRLVGSIGNRPRLPARHCAGLDSGNAADGRLNSDSALAVSAVHGQAGHVEPGVPEAAEGQPHPERFVAVPATGKVSQGRGACPRTGRSRCSPPPEFGRGRRRRAMTGTGWCGTNRPRPSRGRMRRREVSTRLTPTLSTEGPRLAGGGGEVRTLRPTQPGQAVHRPSNRDGEGASMGGWHR